MSYFCATLPELLSVSGTLLVTNPDWERVADNPPRIVGNAVTQAWRQLDIRTLQGSASRRKIVSFTLAETVDQDDVALLPV
jgi:hypothetical protein